MSRTGKKFHGGESNSFYNEKEVRSIDYENQKQNKIAEGATSKENVELSLEVEIADSLKKILTSAKDCTSRLLDVTIIRPKESESTPQVETNTVAFDKNEIRDLITIIEKQKTDKKKRIEEQKKKLHKRIHERKYKTLPPQIGTRSEINRPKSPKTVRINQKPEYIEESKNHHRRICVNSAPPNFTLQKEKHNFDLKCLKFDMKDGQAKIDYAKKLKKYKDIEGRLLELCAASKSRHLGNKCSFSESAGFSDRSNLYSQSTPTNLGTDHLTQHVYATQRTFDDLRQKFKCTNPDKTGKPEEPCVCQHCGMMGLLMDSQKGPVLPATTKSGTPWQPSHDEIRPSSDRRSTWKDNIFIKSLGSRQQQQPGHHDCLLKQMNIRLKSLEERVSIQEETAVSRDYFKVIMNKLLMSYKNNNESPFKKETSIQVGKSIVDPNASQGYFRGFSRPNVNFPFRKSNRENKHYFNDKKRVHYQVNTAIIQPGPSTTDTVGLDSFVEESEISCHTYSKADVKFDKIDEVEENRINDSDGDNLKEKELSFWRWGEEIIKPGFDLKNKIMSLLEEKLQNLKAPKVTKPTRIETDACTQVELASVEEKGKGGVNILPERKYFDERGLSVPTKKSIKHEEEKSKDTDYPFDVRRCVDDTTFRKNIEQCKKNSHYKEYEKLRREMYDSGDISSGSDRTRIHRPSRSAIDVRKLNKKGGLRVKTRTYVTPEREKEFLSYGSDESYAPRCEKRFIPQHEQRVDFPPYMLERKRSNLNTKTVRVSYVNPKASCWREESVSSGGSKSSRKKHRDGKRRSKSNISEQLHFLQKLARSKNVNEEIMWNSVRKQAKHYSHKKKGTVKIQIPTEAFQRILPHEERVTELELTIADLQNILAKAKPKEHSSTGSLNTSTYDHRKKLQELHKHLGVMLMKNRPKFGI